MGGSVTPAELKEVGRKGRQARSGKASSARPPLQCATRTGQCRYHTWTLSSPLGHLHCNLKGDECRPFSHSQGCQSAR